MKRPENFDWKNCRRDPVALLMRNLDWDEFTARRMLASRILHTRIETRSRGEARRKMRNAIAAAGIILDFDEPRGTGLFSGDWSFWEGSRCKECDQAVMHEGDTCGGCRISVMTKQTWRPIDVTEEV